jgi:hypothetical protein
MIISGKTEIVLSFPVQICPKKLVIFSHERKNAQDTGQEFMKIHDTAFSLQELHVCED